MDMFAEAIRYNETEMDSVALEMFNSSWSSRELAGELANEYHYQGHSSAFWDAYNTGKSAWVRGVICSALADKGVTLSRINLRKS